jgi:hypothetical protein
VFEREKDMRGNAATLILTLSSAACRNPPQDTHGPQACQSLPLPFCYPFVPFPKHTAKVVSQW